MIVVIPRVGHIEQTGAVTRARTTTSFGFNVSGDDTILITTKLAEPAEAAAEPLSVLSLELLEQPASAIAHVMDTSDGVFEAFIADVCSADLDKGPEGGAVFDRIAARHRIEFRI